MNGLRLTREPAAWGALFAAAISIAAVFDFPYLQGEQSTAIIAVVDALVGLWVAASVRPFAPSSVTYLITAAVVASGTYGLHFHEDKVAAFNAAVVMFIFALTRMQQSPKKDPGGTPEQIVSTKI
jgi:intracellular septation protein A